MSKWLHIFSQHTSLTAVNIIDLAQNVLCVIADLDFDSKTQFITFVKGRNQASVNVAIKQDAISELKEVFLVVIVMLEERQRCNRTTKRNQLRDQHYRSVTLKCELAKVCSLLVYSPS